MKIKAIIFVTLSTLGCFASDNWADDLLQKARTSISEKDLNSARTYCQQILERDKDNFSAYFQLGLIAYSDNEYYESLEHYTNCLRTINDRYSPASAYHNMGTILHEIGNINEAYFAFEQAIKNSPNITGSYKHLAEIDLMRSEWQKGWEKFEHEWEKNWNEKKAILQRKDLSDCTILIRDGDGFGDTFNWIRYAKLLKKKNAKIIVHTRPSLMRMLQMCPYIDECIPWNKEVPECTMSIALIQLNEIFADDVDSIPNDVPYLHVDETNVKYWQKTLPKNRFNIGICWECRTYKDATSGKSHTKHRAIPLEKLYKLSTVDNVQLINLQKNGGLSQINELPSNHGLYVFNNIDKNGAFTDSSAIMKNLDLVLTIDTATAHLAGALGVPVWVILPYNADWRWFLDRDDSPWYPTMRLFRQPEPGDWDSVITTVKQELEKIIRKK